MCCRRRFPRQRHTPPVIGARLTRFNSAKPRVQLPKPSVRRRIPLGLSPECRPQKLTLTPAFTLWDV